MARPTRLWLASLLFLGGCSDGPTGPVGQPSTPDPVLDAIWGSQGSGNGEFQNPHGIAVDGHGSTYIADFENHRVQKFAGGGQFVAAWPIPGRRPGALGSPRDVALDDNGNVYVADIGNDRILVYDDGGRLLDTWGERGVNPGELYRPIGLAIARGDVFVVDGSQRVQRFDRGGAFKTGWTLFDGSLEDFPDAFGIDVDADGAVWIAEHRKNRVRKFDRDGGLLLSLDHPGATAGSLQGPISIAVDGYGRALVAESGGSRVQMFDSHGRFILQWTLATPCAAPYGCAPIGIATSATGEFLVLDANGRVLEYRMPLANVTRDWWTWGQYGTELGGLYEPHGIAFDRGVVFVSDALGRVQAFSSEGDFLLQLGSRGVGEGQLSYPEGVVTVDGRVFVADAVNRRIEVFDVAGNPHSRFAIQDGPDGDRAAPRGLAADADGNIYVCATSRRIDVFTNAGVLFRSFEVVRTGPYSYVPDVGVLSDGTVLVTESLCRCVQRFDASGAFTGNFVAWAPGTGSPVGLTTSADDHVFVTAGSRVLEYDDQGTLVTSWGSAGSCEGEFSQVPDLVLDTEGRVFALDSGNNRVQVFVPPYTRQGAPFGQLRAGAP